MVKIKILFLLNASNDEAYKTKPSANSPGNETGLILLNDELDNKQGEDVSEGCFAQEARLNLWFSIAVATGYLMCAFLGPLIRLLGMRNFRLLFIIIYEIGNLCLGFASPESAWLICPGLCCTGIGGIALYATNLQVTILFPAIQSTITAFFVGLFDISSIIPQLVKLAFVNGVPRKVAYLALAILHATLFGTSSCFILPAVIINPLFNKKTQKQKSEKQSQEAEIFLNDSINIKEDEAKLTLCQTAFSSLFILHVYWMSVKVLRFVTFIGILNIWMKNLFKNNTKTENQYLSIFAYITFGTVVSGLMAGRLHDWQRRKYLDENDLRRRNLPIIIPFLVTSFICLACTASTLIKHEAALYTSFVLFTLYRTFIFSYEVTFINDAFPLAYFTELYGIISSFAGLAGLLQYAMFEWYESYSGSPVHVAIFFLILEVSTLAHPLNIWYKCHKQRHDTQKTCHRQEIIVASPIENENE